MHWALLTFSHQPVCNTPDLYQLRVSVQALPIFLDRLVDSVTAVVLSVTVVLFFGESRLELIHDQLHTLQPQSFHLLFISTFMQASSFS